MENLFEPLLLLKLGTIQFYLCFIIPMLFNDLQFKFLPIFIFMLLD